MSLSTVRLSLLIGRGVPTAAPARLMSALESVEVNQSDDGDASFSQGFQISFRAERGGVLRDDYELVTDPRLKPGSRVVVSVTVGARPRVLIDGIITNHQFTPGSGQSGARLTVTGKDLSVLMDMVDVTIGYPALGHAAIAALVLAKYAAFGVMPMIVPPLRAFTSLPLEVVPYQSETDRNYLKKLAASHGYIFGIKPGPAPLTNIAYWGPAIRIGLPQKPLTVDMGQATNVLSLQFQSDALTPVQVVGALSEPESPSPLPFAALLSLGVPLSSRPALVSNQPFVRKKWHTYEGDDLMEAWDQAQGETNRSAEAAVQGSGSLDVLRYGDLLTAPGIVGLRGAGKSYDGLFYVKNVKHSIQQGAYTQEFTITREGTGSLVNRV